MTHDSVPPPWRRPPGVAKGTWQYVHQRTIARHYDDFVADTPLCQLDRQYVLDHLTASLAPPAPKAAVNSGSVNHLVLDLGCGTGRLSQPICESGADVLAIDLSQPMLEELSVTDPGDTPRVMPLRANLVQLDAVRDSIADHAICMFSTLGMIQGHANRIQFLSHVARVVRPGGTLVLHVHRRWAAIRELGGITRLLRSFWYSVREDEAEFGDATYAYRGLEDMFMHRFTSSEVSAELMAAGWTVDRIDQVDLTGQGLTDSTWNSAGFFVVCTNQAA